jgi:RNA polymerase primary sigma factor
MCKLSISPSQSARASLATYFRAIVAIPLLSAEEERELVRRVADGDAAARDHLVRANLRLVVNIARRYLGRGLDLEDLIAEGNLGLMRAVRGFDPSLNTRFSTYATLWIKSVIRRAILQMGRPIRFPGYINTLLLKWRRTSTRLREEYGRFPTEEEVARRVALAPKKLRNVLHAVRVCSAMPLTGNAFEEWHPEKYQADPRSAVPDNHLVQAEELYQVLALLDRLEERQVRVLCLRFGLGGERPRTLDEIGKRFGLTRERVRQIEKGALDELAELLQGA